MKGLKVIGLLVGALLLTVGLCFEFYMGLLSLGTIVGTMIVSVRVVRLFCSVMVVFELSWGRECFAGWLVWCRARTGFYLCASEWVLIVSRVSYFVMVKGSSY